MEHLSYTPQQFNKDHLEHRPKNPIIASIGMIPYHRLKTATELKWKWRNIYSEENTKKGVFEGNGYTISQVDSSNKYSLGYYTCTGIIICGKDSKTKEEISLMTHQAPSTLSRLFFERQFSPILIERITNLVERSEKDTIDTVIFGGSIRVGADNKDEYLYYESQIETLTHFLKSRFNNINPTIITGPSREKDKAQYVFLDTKRRRLFIDRSIEGADQEMAFPLEKK